jgi:hypothetical protein
VGRQVIGVNVTLSSLQTGAVPTMTIQLTPSAVVSGGGTVTLAALGDAALFAPSTPTNAMIAVVGLPNCSGAFGTINPVNRTLTITLPSNCTLTPNATVSIQVPSAFFAPNPAPGTTVAFAVTTSADTDPVVSPALTIGITAVPSPIPPQPLPACVRPAPRLTTWYFPRLSFFYMCLFGPLHSAAL